MARRAAEFGVVHRRRGRVDMKTGEGAQGRRRRAARATASSARCRATENCTVIRGHARFVAPHAVRGRRRRARGAADLHQCRRPRRGAADARASTQVPLSHQQHDAGRGRRAASISSIVGGSYIGLEFAQMYRRFGAAVTVIEIGAAADRRARTRTSPPRSARSSRAKASTFRLGVQRPGGRAGAATASRSASTADGAPDDRAARICCSRSGGGPNTDDLGLDKRRRRHRRARLSSRWTISCAPTCRASGRSATATAAARSPIPPTTTSRSSPPICSTATARRVTDRIPAYALYTDPPLGRVGMTEAEGAPAGRPALVGTMPWRT